ncbi:polysaccharide deacetylase family protein [Rhizobium sp. LjRoot30]|uniref:polysaccharide deacetylase family protein n=1 Tax=Rhizobium sp. LjRoot30 TaxID=3342320 RepID=UPI003ECE5F1B
MSSRLLFPLLAVTLALTGCGTKPNSETGSLKTSFAATTPLHHKKGANEPVEMEPAAWVKPSHPGGLSGRTLTVGSLSELKLRPKEVILTFDDGPMPGKTEKVLDILDGYGVKATFLMVGQMAETYPAIARKVVRRGHTIGTHTYRHSNLAGMGYDSALSEIARGEKAVEKATSVNAGFFRFPYLSDTRRLRSALAGRGLVVLDVDVDSKDYFKVGPSAVTMRTMESLRRRGSGIILMHDIHKRTATMLPALLNQLKNDGYKVVTLRYKRSRMPGSMLMASAE